jgi:stress-induced morphogen
MNQTQEALKMAIAQFERINNEYPCEEIIDICKEALASQEQEAVLLNVKTHDDKTYKVEVSAPVWQGLSDDERHEVIVKYVAVDCTCDPYEFARAIEAYHGIGVKDAN